MSWRIRSLLLAFLVAGCALSPDVVQPERQWPWCEPGEIGDWAVGVDETGTKVRLFLVRKADGATDGYSVSDSVKREGARAERWERDMTGSTRPRLLLVFGKSFAGHRGRPGHRGGSQPRFASETGQVGGWNVDWSSLSDRALFDLIGKLRGSQHPNQFRRGVQEAVKRKRTAGLSDKAIITKLLRGVPSEKRKAMAEEWAPALGISAKEFLRLYLS